MSWASGVYYFPRADQIIIAWEVFQMNKVFTEGTYFNGVVETYQHCGIAIEGPRGSMIIELDFARNEFEWIGEL